MTSSKEYNYILPNDDNKAINNVTIHQSLIIIGANGSGKSRLGAWIEENNIDKVHRIGGQRVLEFNPDIQITNTDVAKNKLLYGIDDNYNGHFARWRGMQPGGGGYTTSTLNDFDYVLTAFLSILNEEEHLFAEDCRERGNKQLEYRKMPDRIWDRFKKIWSIIFSNREVLLKNHKLYTRIKGQEKEYSAMEMSDGERGVLYLILQCLAVPEGKTIIIDEPEIHIHRSIMNKLFTAIESERKDCLFIYITHDTRFVSEHMDSEKIWVRSYDGEKWQYDKIEDTDMPEELLLEILGDRRPILFVEGTKGSWDIKLYSAIYKNYCVVPCGSCHNVIIYTKAMRRTPKLHNIQCYGLIDRDYRSEEEIESYKKDKIYTLKVAEVENLFLVEEVLKVIRDILAKSDDESIKNVKKYIIKDRFCAQMDDQIIKAVTSHVKYMLTTTDISGNNKDEVKNKLKNICHEENINSIYETIHKEYNEVLESEDYKKVLALFNQKQLAASIGHFLGIQDSEYMDMVIGQLTGFKSEQMINAIKLYLPEEIPNE